MLGTEYNWLASLVHFFRRWQIRLRLSGVVTLAVAACCVAGLLLPWIQQLDKSPPLTAPAATTLESSAHDADWPHVALRLGLLLPQLLPRDR